MKLPLLVGLSLLGCQPLTAATLPPFHVGGLIQYYAMPLQGTSVFPTAPDGFQPFSSGAPFVGPQQIQDASIAAFAFGSLTNGGTVGVSANPTTPIFGLVTAGMQWGIEVVGAASSDRVPVAFSGTGSAGSSIAVGSASTAVGEYDPIRVYEQPNGSYSFTAYLLPNFVYYVGISAQIAYGGYDNEPVDEFGNPILDEEGNPIPMYYGSIGQKSSLIDPDIQIVGPSASAYSLLSSNPGANASTPSVPEPASWAMLVCGFGIVGGALRSRRKTQVVFA